MIFHLLTIIAPVFFGVAFGFVWSRLDKPFDTEFVTSLVFNLGTPLLIFSTLTKLDTDPRAFADLAMVMVVALFLFLIISFLVLKVFGLDQRTYLAAIMIPNTGNIGIPLCFLAFGELGLAFAIIVYTIVSLTQFTLGVAIAAGSFSLMELAKNSLIYAVLAALLVMVTDYQLPNWLANTVHIFSQFAIPLMLIMLGVSIAKLKVTRLRRNLALSCVRLTMGLSVGLFVSHLFGLEGVARGVVVLECSMPAAVFNYMLAMRYENSPEEVAGLVVTSTLFSFATLPLLLAFILSL
ncbi:MAG TPA: AEC family transporter [Rhodospirillales bacterium]|nr:AEC family transporter [Rhodospirillales bacterium]